MSTIGARDRSETSSALTQKRSRNASRNSTANCAQDNCDEHGLENKTSTCDRNLQLYQEVPARMLAKRSDKPNVYVCTQPSFVPTATSINLDLKACSSTNLKMLMTIMRFLVFNPVPFEKSCLTARFGQVPLQALQLQAASLTKEQAGT
eukprot:TRINITY_DN49670_c0_g1_i2.p1 TRINITY_DN49670_c0_g1~~TRINITY_DN49670_c0_g1_i2.p1  ORF type:complete len:149 (-),score=7.31 TRINITY_DN49670_c0_g1_i2:64-510(-)